VIGSGWLCPQCNTVYAPTERTCTRCVPTVKLGFGTIISAQVASSSGTYQLGNIGLSGMSGTFYCAPRPPTPPLPTYWEARADEVIAAWKKDGGWSTLRTLIIEAMDDAVEHAEEDDDDE